MKSTGGGADNNPSPIQTETTMTTIDQQDTDAVSPFWKDLSGALERNLTRDQMAKFLDDYRGHWPHIEADIEVNQNLKSTLQRALNMVGRELP